MHQFKAAGGRLASANASVLKATADRGKAEADVKAMKSRVDVAAAAAQYSETMLGYAKVRAPYDGVVTLLKVKNGALVQPAGGQNDWLFTVARVDPVRVVVAVPEADAELVKEKAEVTMTVQALPGPSFRGTVARTSWSLDQGSRTLRTEIDLPNKDKKRQLRPGMYVYAHIVGQSAEGLALPVSALAKQGDGLVCFLIEGDKAVQIFVQVGRSDGQFVEVLKRRRPGSPPVWEDFTKDDRIADRAAGLTDGQVVRIDGPGK